MAQLVSRAHSVWEGSLDTSLLRLSANDKFTVRDACENVLVVGGIGSGKTSGPGRTIRRAIFRAGAGLLCLVNKPDEVQACLEDAKATGRLASVIRVDETHGFNFIQHEISRHGLAGINTVIEFLMKVTQIVANATQDRGKASDSFWIDSKRQVLRNAVPVLYAADGTVEINKIILMLQSAPRSADEFHNEEWQKRSFWYKTMKRASETPLFPLSQEALDRIIAYWRDEFGQFESKLRMNVVSTVSTALDRFTHGRLKHLFCGKTTFVPELTFNGAILILDAPVLSWNEDGLIAQQIIKYAWQRIVLSRNSLPPQFRDRLLCCYVDEAQAFLNSYDREFLSLSRSSRCVSVFLTQSLPSVIASIGGDNPKHEADALLAQFGTKVFCNNSCPETNRFAADTIGRTIHRRGSYNEGRNSGTSSGVNMGEGSNSGTSFGSSHTGGSYGSGSHSSNSGTNSGYSENTGRNRAVSSGESTTTGYSETMDSEIEAAEFSRSLLTGGPANNNIVSAIWFSAGRRFQATGRNWLLANFKQGA